MAIERTLSIIKPDAVAKNIIGKIYSRFESNGSATRLNRFADVVLHSFSNLKEFTLLNKLKSFVKAKFLLFGGRTSILTKNGGYYLYFW